MNHIQAMTSAYLEAINFTETGDDHQPEPGTPVTALTKAKAYIDCRNFYCAVTEELGVHPGHVDWTQAGCDLWLTRNNHGTGYWDRPELYGKNVKPFSALAKAMGGHDAEFLETQS